MFPDSCPCPDNFPSNCKIKWCNCTLIRGLYAAMTEGSASPFDPAIMNSLQHALSSQRHAVRLPRADLFEVPRHLENPGVPAFCTITVFLERFDTLLQTPVTALKTINTAI
uniref:Uncharacterized protein n=1 Tax=Scleropages formosus TaxID=113540 RepID=A0A8C9VMW1_SCLFO